MSSRWSASPAQRAQRKQDLLLASRLMRLHADAALGDLGERVDTWAERARLAKEALHRLVTSPAALVGGAALALAATAWRQRRRPTARSAGTTASAPWLQLWSLGWTAWRLWRSTSQRGAGRR